MENGTQLNIMQEDGTSQNLIFFSTRILEIMSLFVLDFLFRKWSMISLLAILTLLQ